MQLRRNAVTQSVTSCPPETERLQGLIRKEALENVTLFDLVLTFLLNTVEAMSAYERERARD